MRVENREKEEVYSSSGFGGSGGGGGTFPKPPIKGENDWTLKGDDIIFAFSFMDVNPNPSSGNKAPFRASFDTRASSSCVSWIYSAGGRGMSGGGPEGFAGADAR